MDGSERRVAASVVEWVRGHRSIADAAGMAVLAIVLAALGIVGLWTVFSVLPGEVSPWWSLATALPACALVPFRARAPLALLGVALVLFAIDLMTVGGVVTLVVVLDLLYAATRATSASGRRRILLGIVIAVAGIGVVALAAADDVRVAVVVALQLGALAGMDYWYATSVAQAHELVALHQGRAEDAERLAARDRDAAMRREREQMARELHDLVAGHVAAIAIRAEAALSTDPAVGADRAALIAVRDSSLEAHQALRSMIAVLRTGDAAVVSPHRGAIPALVDDARRQGLTVTLDDTLSGDIPSSVELAVARIVQESLANCLRHAAGAAVDVVLDSHHGDVRVRVDSRGGRPATAVPMPGTGWGLELLQERARALGGAVEAAPSDAGWSVRATIPAGVHA
ncbi:signal transduction histidine kinase [Microbacterium trichothecenolyticum]|uniref:sensor histidine kinase n=1 Tax=Microbacterium trichothecenolyticum TaxID=69370 RepID=UPI0028669ED1|nr:histidine kinase [Microbacterium trichothecenolyticum]MDR7184216.1 signal transduction histidine kinase [Microbacterium trichothecenolyticum]